MARWHTHARAERAGHRPLSADDDGCLRRGRLSARAPRSSCSSASFRTGGPISSPRDWRRRSTTSSRCRSPPKRSRGCAACPSSATSRRVSSWTSCRRFGSAARSGRSAKARSSSPDEPLVRVTAPALEAQLVETALLATVGFQTSVASKASRIVDAARGRTRRGVRQPSRTRSRGRMPRGACRLSRRVPGHVERRSGPPVRHSRGRDDGAFVGHGVRGRSSRRSGHTWLSSARRRRC